MCTYLNCLQTINALPLYERKGKMYCKLHWYIMGGSVS